MLSHRHACLPDWVRRHADRGPPGNSKPRWIEPCFLLFAARPTTSCSPKSSSRLAAAALPSWRLLSSYVAYPQGPLSSTHGRANAPRRAHPRVGSATKPHPLAVCCGEAMQAHAPACSSRLSSHSKPGRVQYTLISLFRNDALCPTCLLLGRRFIRQPFGTSFRCNGKRKPAANCCSAHHTKQLPHGLLALTMVHRAGASLCCSAEGTWLPNFIALEDLLASRGRRCRHTG